MRQRPLHAALRQHRWIIVALIAVLSVMSFYVHLLHELVERGQAQQQRAPRPLPPGTVLTGLPTGPIATSAPSDAVAFAHAPMPL